MNKLNKIFSSIPALNEYQGYKFYQQHARYDNPIFAKLILASMVFCVGYIESCDREQKKYWQSIQENSSDLSKIYGQRCILLFEAEQDHNGALGSLRPSVSQMKSFQENKVLFVFRKIRKSQDLVLDWHKLAKQNNKIALVLINGHGNQKSINFGTELYPENLENEVRNLPKGTSIVLVSCSTGKGKGCFAEKISSYNRYVTVIAPSANAWGLTSNINYQYRDNQIIPSIVFQKMFSNNITAYFQGGKNLVG